MGSSLPHLEPNAPGNYGPRYFREKYHCDADNVREAYFKVEEDDPEDYTRCTV
jgi:hypothetical protein